MTHPKQLRLLYFLLFTENSSSDKMFGRTAAEAGATGAIAEALPNMPLANSEQSSVFLRFLGESKSKYTFGRISPGQVDRYVPLVWQSGQPSPSRRAVPPRRERTPSPSPAHGL
jgi:hypothetical protein